ncbi:RNA polymerase sigma-70 factor [Chitinophaga niabensis]|uniref:RNA polymerase sigma-70 factor, ECF subfamily n=1 Tax=Chitinophaga niabensis TaxID=536979 RepID=A0A1N6KEX0_9BACT|nr:RNA polymerase sigma-70 factor [Chitinophaga niabensis]SIO55120.1 RNA polymerase sigma-70 factor, ECF subfamily [Chitinophaga niabensis]
MSEKINNERELLASVARADERAFEKIVHHYYPRLLPFVINITKTKYAAEEIVQEVFLRLWQHRHEHERIYNLSSWLFTIASNLSLTYIKRAALEGKLLKLIQLSQAESTLDAEERLNWKESGLLIHEAVQRLPPQQQLIYQLSRQEGLSNPEIAERLKLSPNTVKNHLVKAIQSIRVFIRRTTTIFF